MRQRGYGIFLRSPNSGSAFIFVGYAFVDDTDIVVNDPSPSATPESVTLKLQQSINFWEATLRASGGALAPAKCHWYLIDYRWQGNQWFIVPPSDSQATITVRSPSGRRVTIDRVDPSEARKTLGVWTAPTGSMDAELEYLKTKVQSWVEKIRVRHLPHHLVWLSLRTGILKTLEYPLASTTFTPLQCRELCAPLWKVGLSRSHIVRSMPRDVVYGPPDAGGFALPNLYIEQGLAQLRTYLQFGRSRTFITGFLLRSSVEYLQLELGSLGSPFAVSFDTWAHCAVDTWCTSLWRFVSSYAISLPAITEPFPLLRIGDRPIMESFWRVGYRSPRILRDLNACRLALRALTLADIVTTDGRHVRRDAWEGSAPCSRRRWIDSWPRSPPLNVLNWTLWRDALQTTFGVHPQFRSVASTLGSWTVPPTLLHTAFYCPRSTRLYLPVTDDTWRLHTAIPVRRGRPRFAPSAQIVSWATMALIPSLCPADVYGPASSLRLLTHDSYPYAFSHFFKFPRCLPSFSWDHHSLRPFSQVWFDPPDASTIVHLLRAIMEGSLATFSDGSAQHHREGSCAWGLAFADSSLADLSGGFRIPGPPSAQCSFRSELGGLLAILTVLRQVVRQFPSVAGTIVFATDSKAVLDRFLSLPRPACLTDHSWDMASMCIELLNSMPHLHLVGRHVRGHQDVGDQPLDIWARRNVAMDERATLVYTMVDAPSQLPVDLAPLPPLSLRSETIVHNFTASIRSHTLRPPILQHWQHLGRFGASLSPNDDVAWPSYSDALQSLPLSRKHWVIKSTAQRSAVGVEMRRRRAWPTATCPICQIDDETSTHVFRCPDQRVTTIWLEALLRLDQWLARQFTNPVAARAILLRLHEWVTRQSPSPITTTVPFLSEALEHQECLGWEATLYGFWAPEWAEMQDVYYRFIGRRNTGRRWLSQLIVQIWNTAWDLWEHRNGVLQEVEQERIRRQRLEAIRSLYANPPSRLTPALRLLLRRPLPQRLQDSQQSQEAFLRRFTNTTTRPLLRNLRIQQSRFRTFFRPPPSPPR